MPRPVRNVRRPAAVAASRPPAASRTAANRAPEPERLVSDAETLRAISDPLRLRILETMVTDAGRAWSVKELASELEVPQTRLYHHIDVLAERDLIRVADQRLVSGILETRYRVAALTLRLDPKLVSSADQADATAQLVANVLDAARGELLAAVRADVPNAEAPAPDRPLITRGMALLTPARAGEFRARLQALLDEFDGASTDPAARAYGLLLAFYRAERLGGGEPVTQGSTADGPASGEARR